MRAATGNMTATAQGDDQSIYIYIKYFSLAVKVKVATGDMTAAAQGDDQPRREGVKEKGSQHGPP